MWKGRMPNSFIYCCIALSKIKQQSCIRRDKHTNMRDILLNECTIVYRTLSLRIMSILRAHVTIHTARRMPIGRSYATKEIKKLSSDVETHAHLGMCKYRKVTWERTERKSVAVFTLSLSKEKIRTRLTQQTHRASSLACNVYGIKASSFRKMF